MKGYIGLIFILFVMILLIIGYAIYMKRVDDQRRELCYEECKNKLEEACPYQMRLLISLESLEEFEENVFSYLNKSIGDYDLSNYYLDYAYDYGNGGYHLWNLIFECKEDFEDCFRWCMR